MFHARKSWAAIGPALGVFSNCLACRSIWNELVGSGFNSIQSQASESIGMAHSTLTLGAASRSKIATTGNLPLQLLAHPLSLTCRGDLASPITTPQQ